MAAVLRPQNTGLPTAKYLPYSTHVSPSIITTKAGDYLSVWKLAGRPFTGASKADREAWIRNLNNLVRGVGTEHVSFWAHTIRHKVSALSEGEFESPYCRALNDKLRAKFAGSDLRVNDLYLTVAYRPTVDAALSIFAFAEKPSLAERMRQRVAAIEKLDSINLAVGASLAPYGARLLTTYERNGYSFSASAEFLARLVNGYDQPMPVFSERFADYMANGSRPIFSTWGNVGESRSLLGSQFLGMMQLKKYGGVLDQKTGLVSTFPGQLDRLLELPFDFTLTQSFSCHAPHKAKHMMEVKRNHMEQTNDVGKSEIDGINLALDQLMASQFVIGDHHCSLMVTTDHIKHVDDAVTANMIATVRDQMAEATAAMQSVGMMPEPADLDLVSTYWAQLPCNWKWISRPTPITSLNFLSFASQHNYSTGRKTSVWGPSVTMFRTTSGTPYHFNFHADGDGDREVGNTMLIGKAGTGKTVLLSLLLAQAQKFGPTSIVFDNKRGLEIAIRAMGGCYAPLRANYGSAGFNPFQMEPTPHNLTYLKGFLKARAGANGEPVTHADEQEIDQALKTLMFEIDKSQRRFSTLLHSLPKVEFGEGPPSVHERLEKWCRGGEYGWIFDNATDDLDLTTHRTYGFDTTEFIENPDTRDAIMSYIMHRAQQMMDGRPFIYVFDEFQKPLEDAYFQKLARDLNRTIRSKNGIFVFATQEPGAVLENPIASTLVQQCATFILLPNPGANRAEYTEGFKLSDTEFDLVAGLAEGSRRFLVKQGGASVVVENNLAGMADDLMILSGTPERAARAEEVIAEIGDDPQEWLPVFVERERRRVV